MTIDEMRRYIGPVGTALSPKDLHNIVNELERLRAENEQQRKAYFDLADALLPASQSTQDLRSFLETQHGRYQFPAIQSIQDLVLVARNMRSIVETQRAFIDDQSKRHADHERLRQIEAAIREMYRGRAFSLAIAMRVVPGVAAAMAEITHDEKCDQRDIYPEKIAKPCNCGAGRVLSDAHAAMEKVKP